MRYTKVILRLMFLFTCMLPRRSADGLGYTFFIFLPFTLGLFLYLEWAMTGKFHVMENMISTFVTYYILIMILNFKLPFRDEQRHINRLVFKNKHRFLYAMLALLVSFLCIISLPLMMISTKFL